MKKLMKRGLAAVLALMMCVGMLATTSFAANVGDVLGTCGRCGGSLIAQGFSDAKGDAYYCDGGCGASGQMLPSTPEPDPKPEEKPETKPDPKPETGRYCPGCGKNTLEEKAGDGYVCYRLHCACGYAEAPGHEYKTDWQQEFCDNCGAKNPNYKPPVEKPHVHKWELEEQFLSSGSHTYKCTNDGCDIQSKTEECKYTSTVTDPITGKVIGEVCGACGGTWYYSDTCSHNDKTYTCIVEAGHGVPGKKTWLCNLCGRTDTEDCPALPDECAYPDAPAETVEPTCTTDGYEVYYCKYHGQGCDRDPKKVVTGKAHDHSYEGAEAVYVNEEQHQYTCVYAGKYPDISHPQELEEHKWTDETTFTDDNGLLWNEKHCFKCGYQVKTPVMAALTVNYVVSGGSAAAPAAYSQELQVGASYEAVVSPALEGYTVDRATVEGGKMVVGGITETVTYTFVTTPEPSQPVESESPSPSPSQPVTPPTTPPTTPPLEEITEPDVPLGEDAGEMTDIPDGGVPLGGDTSDLTDIPDDGVPLSGLPDELNEIDDGAVPLADVPQTGDISMVWYGVSALSACGLTAVCVSKKREDEEE